MGNVSLSIAALCHTKNLPELETWFRDIVILEWEQGKLDKYVGILRIVNNALILINGNKIIFRCQWSYTRHGNYCIQQSYIHLGSYQVLYKYFQGA